MEFHNCPHAFKLTVEHSPITQRQKTRQLTSFLHYIMSQGDGSIPKATLYFSFSDSFHSHFFMSPLEPGLLKQYIFSQTLTHGIISFWKHMGLPDNICFISLMRFRRHRIKLNNSNKKTTEIIPDKLS